MKTIYAVLLLIFCGCGVDEQYKYPIHDNGITHYKGYEISTIQYDSHDYIFVRDVKGGYHTISIIHSPSCKFCSNNK